MALSLLQDAQTRGIAAALANMTPEDFDRLSMSPPMSGSLYQNEQAMHTAAALRLLPPHILAANRTAAAFMATHMPMSSLASALFPQHQALISSWTSGTTPVSVPPLAPVNNLPLVPQSPPDSPHSPHRSQKSKSALRLLRSPKSDCEGSHKKIRRVTVKKDLHSTATIDVGVCSDVYHTPSGPISPPSSGSSPNSVNETSVPVKDTSRDKSFTCKICNRSFGYKHVLQNHERTHTGEKPFECPECHKRFTRDHHLKTHMRLHTGEKPYHCSHCDRQFVQVANLRRHLRVHTGERPYSCDVCDGRFSDSNQLKSHMLSHNDEKPFECEHCHMKFRRRHHQLHHKCGIQSPPTPAISPAISNDYTLCDQKSAISSFGGSDESISIVTATPIADEAPLDLSEDSVIITNGRVSAEKRQREIDSLFLVPSNVKSTYNPLPVQTEPEDLSMHSPRSRHETLSPLSSHHDDDLDDLDDAVTLHIRQRQKQTKSRKRSHINIRPTLIQAS